MTTFVCWLGGTQNVVKKKEGKHFLFTHLNSKRVLKIQIFEGTNGFSSIVCSIISNVIHCRSNTPDFILCSSTLKKIYLISKVNLQTFFTERLSKNGNFKESQTISKHFISYQPRYGMHF
jgi:hypothetical protein